MNETLKKVFGTSDSQSASSPAPGGVLGPSDLISRNQDRKRGPRGPYRKRAPGETTPANPVAATPAPAAPIFNDKHAEILFGAPFKLAAAYTGCPHLLLDEDEKKAIGPVGASVLNDWLPVHPKYVSLVVFSIAFTEICATKYLILQAWKEAMEQKRKEAQAQAAAHRPSAT